MAKGTGRWPRHRHRRLVRTLGGPDLRRPHGRLLLAVHAGLGAHHRCAPCGPRPSPRKAEPHRRCRVVMDRPPRDPGRGAEPRRGHAVPGIGCAGPGARCQPGVGRRSGRGSEEGSRARARQLDRPARWRDLVLALPLALPGHHHRRAADLSAASPDDPCWPPGALDRAGGGFDLPAREPDPPRDRPEEVALAQPGHRCSPDRPRAGGVLCAPRRPQRHADLWSRAGADTPRTRQAGGRDHGGGEIDQPPGSDGPATPRRPSDPPSPADDPGSLHRRLGGDAMGPAVHVRGSCGAPHSGVDGGLPGERVVRGGARGGQGGTPPTRDRVHERVPALVPRLRELGRRAELRRIPPTLAGPGGIRPPLGHPPRREQVPWLHLGAERSGVVEAARGPRPHRGPRHRARPGAVVRRRVRRTTSCGVRKPLRR